MDYKIRTNWETLGNVFRILKRLSMEGLITGQEFQEMNLWTLGELLFEKGTMNEFCQAVTGIDKDFEKECDYVELESVILGFFECLKESLKDSKLMTMIVNKTETTE